MRIYILTGVMGLTSGEVRNNPRQAPEVFTNYEAARERLLYRLAPYREALAPACDGYQPVTEVQVHEYPLVGDLEGGLLASARISFWDSPHEGRKEQVFTLTHHKLEE